MRCSSRLTFIRSRPRDCCNTLRLAVACGLARVDIGLQFGQRALALVQLQEVLLGVDGVDDVVLLHRQLRAPHIVLSPQQVHRVLALVMAVVAFACLICSSSD